MNFEIFEYLIAIEECGTLNKASQKMYVSQPNLSSAIKYFENEIGYSILNRNHNGVSFTEKGKEVLIIAHKIIEEKNKLFSISNENKSFALNISIGNSQDVFDAIFNILNEIIPDEINLTIVNLPVMEAMESVYKQVTNLSYIIIPTSQDRLVKEYCRIHSLIPTFFAEKSCSITTKKNHPLARMRSFTYENLLDYPFVDYINQKENPYGSIQKYINPRSKILVDSSSQRTLALEKSNAYAIGITPSSKNKNYFYKEIPELKMHLVEIRRKTDENNSLYNKIQKAINI